MKTLAHDFESYFLNQDEVENILLFHWNATVLRDHQEQIVHLQSTLFILIEKGTIDIEINHKRHHIAHKAILLFSFGHSLKLIGVSADFKATMLYIRKDFVHQMYSSDMIYKMTRYGIKLYKAPVLALELDDYNTLNARKALIKEMINQKHHLYHKELSLNALRIFFLDLSHIIEKKQHSIAVNNLSMEEIYFQKFLDLIQVKYKEHHAVHYYAHHINITPHYLTILVKQLTGETVSELIYSLLFSEAQYLLKQPKKTVQQIAEELNFSDQSAFGKFFKRKSGLSPKQYRISLTH